jgi:hypothetical protein
MGCLVVAVCVGRDGGEPGVGQSAIVGGLYILASLICVGLSAFATFRGFETVLGEGAAFAAGAIGIGLMVCNIVLLNLVRRRAKASAFTLPLIALLLFAGFSSISNFTYFYSVVMSDKVAATRFTAAQARFDENSRAAINELIQHDAFNARKVEVERMLRKLREQVESPLEPGFGDLALAHLEEIYAEVQLTRLRPPPLGATAAANQNWLSGFEIVVLNELKLEGEQNPIIVARAQVDQKTAEMAQQFGSFQGVGMQAVPERVAVVAKQEEVTREIQNITVQAIQQIGRPSALRLVPTPHEGMDLFNVNAVFESAFVIQDSVGMALLTGGFAIFLDFIPLLIALVIAAVMGRAAGPSPRRRPSKNYVVLEGTDNNG